MAAETPGITRAGEGFQGTVWNILGQTYYPKQSCENSFAFEAVSPPGTFVPPHIHPTQDEYILMLEGTWKLLLDGQTHFASAGDLVRMPKGIPHGYFNESGAAARAFFWVSARISLMTGLARLVTSLTWPTLPAPRPSSLFAFRLIWAPIG